MKDTEADKFSWQGLFIVTACCSLLFNVTVKILDGYFSPLLFSIALITGLLGIISWTGKVLVRQNNKKKSRGLIS